MSSSSPVTLGWREWIALPFTVLPIQRNSSISRRCQAPLVDIRDITDSGGHTETRHVVTTTLELSDVSKTIEIPLTERREMLFRMLLGRTSLMSDFVVNPALSYVCGRRSSRLLYSDGS